jgi:hypothetical protein
MKGKQKTFKQQGKRKTRAKLDQAKETDGAIKADKW